MLQITIPENKELWDEKRQEFVSEPAITLQLEHSLISLSKWESKWHKSFFTKEDMTNEQTLDYIRCMTLSPKNLPIDVYYRLSQKNVDAILAYINDPMTATTFNEKDDRKGFGKERITSELIYYWMIALQIPVEFEKWHLNRLITLIRVCEIKNTPPKKMSKRDIMSRNAALNAARRKQLGSKG